MDKCKFCGAELPEGSTVCPECGKDQQTKKISAGKTALILVSLAVVVVLAAAILLQGNKPILTSEVPTIPAPVPTTVPTEPPTVPADGNPDDVTCKGTYTAPDADVIAARDTVIATAGDFELTLGQLQAFYWMEVRNFLSQYGAYAGMFGLDYQQSLDTQPCAMDESVKTWQQHFLDSALYAWQSYVSMAAEADANGVKITDEQQANLDGAEKDLNETAVANGYADAAAMIHSSLGGAAEVQDYVYFLETYYKANGYYNHLFEQETVTDEEVEAFFAEHAEGYAQSGITKELSAVNVRHILIYPEGADGTNLATQEFGEEAWAASEKVAQEILEAYLAGDKTEESFAALANERSADPGSNKNGGLYEDVTPGEMVAPFNDWCFDPARQPGDTGIVKTTYGYHVMYYVSSHLLWTEYAKSDLLTERVSAKADAIAQACPLTVHYGDILLSDTVVK